MATPTPKRREIRTVLVANRGEIAARLIRGARDLGKRAVAVYAEPDRDAPFVTLADEAFVLGGETAKDSYLDGEKIIAAAQRAGADAVHPGYGFLSENADFARAVTEAGLVWIGPPPEAIAALGDKVTARHIAERAEAPMAPGTTEPVATAEEIERFADAEGLPIAIKAAFGGGGRGMKIVHERAGIQEAFESATRESVAAFGRGECFVERYLDRARHVECQVVADTHGNVHVVGTRDCSLQRRFQKLVEEAPAPFLTDEQRGSLAAAAKRICAEAGYVGAGTVEFLVGSDGLISFLEVNTRLQVEHPVTEEAYGVDLVEEQFRIAEGEELSIPDNPEPVRHALEFRLNGEDPAANFLPEPGTVTRYEEPAGPGVRVDSGVRTGSVIGGQFDSMLGKLIVVGRDREQALARARRALGELVIEGLPTVVPFHRAIVDDPAFSAPGGTFGVYTRWTDEEWAGLPEGAAPAGAEPAEPEEEPERRRLVVEVNGRRVEVALPGGISLGGGERPKKKRQKRKKRSAPKTDAGSVVAPMQGTVAKVNVADGEEVAEGDVLLVLEAMKMENPVKAHRAGTVSGLSVKPGETVAKHASLASIE
ncbi:acetyl/propionyl/methylcrotonyl-CoA carboxylase subunit alpha [Corynebacterium otitidis]|uniref:biotin carboxylase n=1 Tax=Corynebacterium otitidis ATCC 51513 TaxID=883169 RepID=I7LCM5_9CORY|nr:biotin carboxylase N-terminal domain-containing protein [Corynebacterium otitidis]EJZ81447.1 hypothetical protein HMPREF9719_01634 [Corynebacterium otitidis ATCC 51513]CCI84084.1 biotin carboxylase [Corynebacterium otitidis ATCC 51513]